MLKLCSCVHEKVCKNKDKLKELKEAVVKEVMEESILLGIIEYDETIEYD